MVLKVKDLVLSLTVFMGIAKEIIFDRVNINISEGSIREFFSELVNYLFKFVVEILSNFIEGSCTSCFINLWSCDREMIHNIR